MPDYNDPYIPGAFAQLSWHVGMDGTLYAREMQTGRTYELSPMVGSAPPPSGGGGIAEAPADGQLYGRQDTTWSLIDIPPVPASEVVITGRVDPASAIENTTVPLTVIGTGFTPASVINWGGYPLPTTFVNNTTLQATLNLGPGSSGIYTIVVTDGEALSNSVAFTVNPAAKANTDARTFATADASCTLKINEYGDLIATQANGPNAGKSVNLTYGKWA